MCIRDRLVAHQKSQQWVFRKLDPFVFIMVISIFLTGSKGLNYIRKQNPQTQHFNEQPVDFFWKSRHELKVIIMDHQLYIFITYSLLKKKCLNYFISNPRMYESLGVLMRTKSLTLMYNILLIMICTTETEIPDNTAESINGFLNIFATMLKSHFTNYSIISCIEKQWLTYSSTQNYMEN